MDQSLSSQLQHSSNSQLLSTAFSFSPFSIIIIDVIEQMVIAINDVGLGTLQYNNTEIVNKSAADVCVDYSKLITQTGSSISQIVLKRKDGTLLNCNASIYTFHVADKQYLHLTSLDVDDANSTENLADNDKSFDVDTSKQLQLENEKLADQRNKEALINTTDDLIWSVDRNFNMIAANKEFLRTIKRLAGVEVKTGDNLMMAESFPDEWISFWSALYIRGFNGEAFTEIMYNPEAEKYAESWHEVVIKPINDEGIISGIACYSKNITSRKLLERSEQESLVQQQLYAAIVKTTDDAIFSETIDGIITSWNAGAEKIFGYTAAEVIGNLSSVLISLEIADSEHQVLQSIMQKETVHNYETERVTKKGEKCFISLTLSPILDGGGQTIGIGNIVRDITQKRMVELQTAKSELRYRRMFEQSLAGFYETTVQGTIVNCNEAFSKMLKYDSPQELLHKNVVELYFDETNRIEFINALKHKGSLQNYEGVLRCKDGSPLHFIETVSLQIDEVSGQEIIDGIILDITQRKLTELALASSNERYEFVSKATNDIIWDWNIVTGIITRSAQTMQKVFGYSNSNEISNFGFWRSKMHPDDLEPIENMFEVNFANVDEKFMDCEYRFMRADGTYAYVYDKGYIIRDSMGKPIRMIGAVQDVSKIKESETLLQQRAFELEASNKELEQFAYVASHDLQEPLRMVTSFLTQLNKNYHTILDERARRYIHFAVDGASRMRQLILDLLEFSRVGRTDEKEESVDLNLIIDEINLLFAKKIEEKGVTITSDVLPVVQAERSPLRQLFQNLINNALTYSSKTQIPQIHISVQDNKTHWQFAIADNGIGIEEEFYKKIFIIFQRLHNREEYAGTGMGLAIAKKIVELFNGEIWVQSALGKGSTFYFTIKKN